MHVMAVHGMEVVYVLGAPLRGRLLWRDVLV